MTTPPPHRVAAGLIASGLSLNLLTAARGGRTICVGGREWMHVDTAAGRTSALLGIVGTGVAFAFHFLNPDKRPVR